MKLIPHPRPTRKNRTWCPLLRSAQRPRRRGSRRFYRWRVDPECPVQFPAQGRPHTRIRALPALSPHGQAVSVCLRPAVGSCRKPTWNRNIADGHPCGPEVRKQTAGALRKHFETSAFYLSFSCLTGRNVVQQAVSAPTERKEPAPFPYAIKHRTDRCACARARVTAQARCPHRPPPPPSVLRRYRYMSAE